jgi:hypothetical protein
MSDNELGKCPLCGMEMIDGLSVDRHHLIPKCKKGVEAELCHIVCHRKIHSTIAEGDLSHYWHTWDRLKNHPEISKYVIWVRKKFKKNTEFIDVHRDTKDRKRKRK